MVEIWDALRAAAEADPSLGQAIVESAGIIVHNPDMTLCFDERGNSLISFHPSPTFYLLQFMSDRKTISSMSGARYELPKYVLSEPTNLIRRDP